MPSTGDTFAMVLVLRVPFIDPVPLVGACVCVDSVGDAERDLLPVADLTFNIRLKRAAGYRSYSIQPNRLFESRSDGDPALNVADQILIFSAPDLEDVAPGAYARQILLSPVLQNFVCRPARVSRHCLPVLREL